MNSFIRRFWRAEGSGRATLGIAFAAVAIVGATLGAFYVYRQLAEAELQERNTRAVSSMAEQLAFRINGLVEATDNVSRGCRDAKAWEVSRCLRGRVLGEIPGASEVASGRRLDWLQSLRPERRDHSPFSVFIDGHSPYPKLLFLFDGSSPRAAFEMDLGDVVSAFTRQQPFESLLLTDAKGKVLYRSGSSTTSLLQLSELLDHVTAPGRLPATDGKRPAADTSAGPNGGPQVDHPPTEAAKHSDNGHSIWAETVEIRGMHSLLRLRTFPDGNDVDELRIVGVVRTGKSVNESTIVPPLFAGALLIAALLLLATWPIVQLVLVAPAERIRRRSVWLIAGGGYFAIGLATFVVFSLIEHDGLRRQFDATAVELARTVADRLCTRLHRASSILQTFEDGGGSMSGSDGSGLLYPFEMFVIAERGEVLRRWRGFPSNIYGRPIHLEVLPAAGVGLADRQYFIDADAGVFASCAEHEEEVGEGFSVEVIRSRTTGRPTVTVAKTTQLDQWDTPDSVARVLAMSVPIMLVGKAVLPPGFAYAVVDRTGETLFHSDPRRAKVEALFAETGSAALEAAVRFRAESEPFTVSYYGAPTRVHVRPILGLDDWSVVVLEDLAYSRTIYGLLVSEWALYFSAYSLALWAVLGGIRLLRPEPRSWLWPRSDRGALYVRSTLLIVLALTAAAPIPFLQPWFTTVAAAIVLPGFVLCVLLVNLRWEIGKGRIAGLLLLVLGALLATNLWFAGWYGEYFAGGVWEWVLLASFPAVVAATPLYRWWFRHRTHAYVGAYVALTFLAFAVLAAVPAAAIFRLACAHALETHVRFSQIEILRDVLDATLRARRAVEGDWPRWVADRLHDTVNETSATANSGGGVISPIAWVDVFGGRFDSGEWSDRQRCCCCRAGGYRCSAVCEESGVRPSECLVRRRALRPIANELQRTILTVLGWIGLSAGNVDRIHAAMESALPTETEDGDDQIESDIAFSEEQDLQPVSSQPPRMWVSESFDEAELCLTDKRWKSVLGVAQQDALGFTAELPQPSEPLAASLLLSGLLAVAIFLVVSNVTRRLFVLAPELWRDPTGVGAASTVTSDTVFLMVRTAPGALGSAQPTVVDLRECDRAGDDRRLGVGLLASGVVVLDQLDYRMDALDVSRRKLALIESVLHSTSVTVVLISSVDPVNYFSSAVSTASVGRPASLAGDWDAERRAWARVLDRFDCYRVPLDLSASTGWMFGGVLTDLLLERAAERSGSSTAVGRWARWNALSTAEKLALTQLATEGYANWRAGPTLRLLLQRGLIRREPALAVVDTQFERFVRKVSRSEPIHQWEREAGPRLSDLLGIPLMVALAAVMAVLFTTQNDLALKVGSALTGFATLLPVIVRMLGGLASDRFVKKADDNVGVA